ncbi:MAG: quinone-dependent dihydroorotate dehydrogenase [Alphaproteobacteria bacterium]
MMDLPALALPFLRALPPETAHRLTVGLLANRLATSVMPARPADDPRLHQTLFGLDFPNPLGLAAGFDKNAEAVDGTFRLGFGFVEVGTVTPHPQPGNPRPRLFRLPQDGAVINRMGFNNDGAGRVAERLNLRQARRHRNPGPLGVNIGRNKDQTDAAADYRRGAEILGAFADYLVVNVSSPNTPGLRALQSAENLGGILRATRDGLAHLPEPPPVLVKIAPDLDDEALESIVRTARDESAAALIVSNTTVSRPPGLASPHRDEAGGLSGRPLFPLATRTLAKAYLYAEGALPLIGVGGVQSGADAYAKIRAGASLVQLYTALVFDGPALVGRILRELSARLAADGFADIAAARGGDAPDWASVS